MVRTMQVARTSRTCTELPSTLNDIPTIQQSKWYQIATDLRFSDVILISFDACKIVPAKISLKDFNHEVVKAALDFMLEKPDGIVGKENSLLKFAVQYEILDLIKACSDRANKLATTKTNVIEYIQLAYTHNLEGLKQKCLKFLSENKKEISKAVLNGIPQNIVVDAFHF